MSNHFHTIIIGGGPAGYRAAEWLGSKKIPVCLIESATVGGTCLNEGCIPVKGQIESSKVFHKIKNSEAYGISVNGISFDLSKARDGAKKTTAQLVQGVLFLLNKFNVHVIRGKASFISSKAVKVDHENGSSEELTADYFLIASGSITKTIQAFPVNGRTILTSREMLELQKVPEKLLIIGGGAIGCEFASLYNRLGSSVTLVEMLPQLLPGEDEEVGRTLRREMQKQGIQIQTEAKLSCLIDKNNMVQAVIEADGKTEELIFDCALIAAGRSPNTGGLSLAMAGVECDRGFIPVNSAMQTNIPHIYAAGDVVNTPGFAHTAYREGLIAAESIFLNTQPDGKRNFTINYNNIPRIVFTEPQIGCTGLTESKAKEIGLSVHIYKKFFKSSGKALIEKEDAGFVKIIADETNGKILGGCIIGTSATELIHEIGLAIESGLTVNQAVSFTHGHPTLTELICDTLME